MGQHQTNMILWANETSVKKKVALKNGNARKTMASMLDWFSGSLERAQCYVILHLPLYHREDQG
jgi:hypothetical protein